MDIGSGSGLFSLAARKLGARIEAFDYDLDSVECTKKVIEKEYLNDDQWSVEQGDVLSESYMKKYYGRFDVVYSWGVLHHTGDMYRGLNNACKCVRGSGGMLFVSIYNDQGLKSKIWKMVKKLYCSISHPWKTVLIYLVSIYLYGGVETISLLRRSNKSSYSTERGMDKYTDLIDWVGGYPFEVAKPEDIINYCLKRGFVLEKIKTLPKKALGCNEYLFRKR